MRLLSSPRNFSAVSLVLLALFAVFSSSATAQVLNYYVATNGSDSNDGSQGRPWATIAHADDALTLGPQGTTVHVAPGTYNISSSGLNTNASGASGRPLTWLSDTPQKALLRGSVGGVGSAFWNSNGTYVVIQDFDVASSTGLTYGIAIRGSNTTVQGNKVHDLAGTCTDHGGAGITSYGTTSNLNVLGNEIYHIDNGTPGGGRWCHGIYLGGSGVSASNVYNNIIHDNDTGYCIDVRQNASSGSSWANISNNTCVNNGTPPALCTTQFGSCGGGIVIEAVGGSAKNLVINNNLIYNNPGPGRGIGASGTTITNSQIRNNLIYGNSVNTITQVDSSTTIAGTVTANPQLVSSSDYHPTPNSPAVQAGTSNACLLGLVCVPTVDFSNKSRPNPPTIGSFEVASDSDGPLDPPSGLTVSIR